MEDNEKCTVQCDSRVGSVCMKYAKMIMRNKESNKYDHVNSTEVGIKVPQCLFADSKRQGHVA